VSNTAKVIKMSTRGVKVNKTDNWEETVAEFRRKVVKYKTITQVAGILDLDTQTVKKILKDCHKPHFLCQLKIEEWVKTK